MMMILQRVKWKDDGGIFMVVAAAGRQPFTTVDSPPRWSLVIIITLLVEFGHHYHQNITTVVSCTTVDSPPPCCSLVIIIITVNSPHCFRFTIIITITNTITIVISHVGIGISLSPWWTEAWLNIVTIARLFLGTNISPIFPQVEPSHNHHHWEPFHIWTSQYFCRRELALESKPERLNGNQGHIELDHRPCALTC